MFFLDKESFNTVIIVTNQTISAKVSSREGNSPDYILRFIN